MKRVPLFVLLSLFAATVSLHAAEHHEKEAAPYRVSHGAEVQLTDFLVPGKTTVFDFMSEYCPDCREIAPKLDALHQSRADIAVVKVDVNRAGIKRIDWQSPVINEFHIHALPHFKIFSPDGKLLAEGEAAQRMIDEWVK